MSKDTVLGLLTTLLCATFLPKDVPIWASEYTMPFKSQRAPLCYYRQLLIFIAYISILIYPLCYKGSLSCISPSSTPFCVTSLNPFISVAASNKTSEHQSAKQQRDGWQGLYTSRGRGQPERATVVCYSYCVVNLSTCSFILLFVGDDSLPQQAS
jgi:hypothetical protein